jgi:hypothetical protein
MPDLEVAMLPPPFGTRSQMCVCNKIPVPILPFSGPEGYDKGGDSWSELPRIWTHPLVRVLEAMVDSDFIGNVFSGH